MNLNKPRVMARRDQKKLSRQQLNAAVTAIRKAGQQMRPEMRSENPGTRQGMSPGIIIAIVAAVAIVIGGFIWYSNDQAGQARVDQQRTDDAAQIAYDEDIAREEERGRLAEEEERARQQEQAAADERAARVGGDDVAAEQDDVTVVGDEITDGAIVVQSATDGPTILYADETASTVELVGDSETAAMRNTEARGSIVGGTDVVATSTEAEQTEAEQLLTRENFERDEVLALINDSDLLTDDERSTLRALVDGATANPAMVDATIDSIRAALDLPPLG